MRSGTSALSDPSDTPASLLGAGDTRVPAPAFYPRYQILMVPSRLSQFPLRFIKLLTQHPIGPSRYAQSPRDAVENRPFYLCVHLCVHQISDS